MLKYSLFRTMSLDMAFWFINITFTTPSTDVYVRGPSDWSCNLGPSDSGHVIWGPQILVM